MNSDLKEFMPWGKNGGANPAVTELKLIAKGKRSWGPRGEDVGCWKGVGVCVYPWGGLREALRKPKTNTVISRGKLRTWENIHKSIRQKRKPEGGVKG